MFKSKILKIHAIILAAGLIFLSLYFTPAANAGGKIVKWVDAQGVTHYGDKLPVEQAGKNNTEMNTQGMAVKRNAPAEKKDEAAAQATLDAQRKDNILLASYTKAEEIDLARDRSLEMDNAAVQALTTQKENINGRLARNQKTASGFANTKKPVPAYLADEIKLAKAEAQKVDKQIADRKVAMEATRKRFAAEKARFIELKQASVPDASAMMPATTEPVAAQKTTPTPAKP